MTNTFARTMLLLTGAATLATPALARRHSGPAPLNDSNSYWLDYKTDISEAKRELASDLRHAHGEGDRAHAYAEYRHEIADARYDFNKAMARKGYTVSTGTVTVEDEIR